MIYAFWLNDDQDARARALTAAMDAAHAKAVRMATASGGTLDHLIRAQDANYREVDAAHDTQVASFPVPAPAAPGFRRSAQIVITVKPEPIYTQAEIMAVYAVRP